VGLFFYKIYLDIEIAIRYANAVGELCVSKVGTQSVPPTKKDLVDFLNNRRISNISLRGMITARAICFVFAMGEFIGAMTLITKSNVFTIPLAIAGFITRYTVDFGGLTASAVLAVIFPIAFVLIFQRFLIRGITAGAVKE